MYMPFNGAQEIHFFPVFFFFFFFFGGGGGGGKLNMPDVKQFIMSQWLRRFHYGSAGGD